MKPTSLLPLMMGLLLLPLAAAGQDAGRAPVEPGGVLRVEGTDAATGVRFVRLSVALPAIAEAMEKAGPRFTVECDDVGGKRGMQWFVSLDGAPDPGFQPPFRPTDQAPFPPKYPAVDLKMWFEGYIKSKPFTRSWSQLPSGELLYRNPGMQSPNMDSPRYFLTFLNSLPGLHIGRARQSKGESVAYLFPTQPLLDALNKTPACAP